MALGALAAVNATGRREKVLVAGFDHIAAVRPMIADGRMVATADQDAGELAVSGIEAALDLLSSGGTPADRTTKVDLITP